MRCRAVRHHRLQSTAATSRLHTGCTQCTKEASDYVRLPLKAISSIFSNLFVSLTLLKDCKQFSEHSISPLLFENVDSSVQKRWLRSENMNCYYSDILSRLSTLWKSLHEEDINLCTLCVHVVVWCARAFLLARLSVSKYAPVRPFRTQPGVVFLLQNKKWCFGEVLQWIVFPLLQLLLLTTYIIFSRVPNAPKKRIQNPVGREGA